MPRQPRYAPGGVVSHVINRGAGRMKLFGRPADYDAFVQLLAEAARKFPSVRVLAYCIMPNHWHLVLLPANDGDLSRFMSWLTLTHVMRWRAARNVVGLGPLYQGRFKSFPVQTDEHLLTVLRYVERNGLRANLVTRAEKWQWSSLAARVAGEKGNAAEKGNAEDAGGELLSRWPIEQPDDWVELVNQPLTSAEQEALDRSVRTGRPFGNPAWQKRMAKSMGIELLPRPRGRPRGTTKSKAAKK